MFTEKYGINLCALLIYELMMKQHHTNRIKKLIQKTGHTKELLSADGNSGAEFRGFTASIRLKLQWTEEQ